MADPPVLVTGGSGVVGGALVRTLIAGGRTVRGLARSDQAAETLRSLGAEPVAGNILDLESLLRAMDGCEVVYHAAGLNRFCVKDTGPMRRANVGGSTNCVDAAIRTGARRMIYTSSAVTLGEAKGTVGREDSPHRRSFLSAYERSKFDAEQAVLSLAGQFRLDLVCVNPSSVQGPGRSTGTGQVLVQYLRGRLKMWVDTTVSVVDIDDCAEGHVLAEAKGETGQRYVLSAASLTTAELMAVMAEVAPEVAPPRVVPRRVATAGVRAAAGLARLRGKQPLACGESLRTLLHGHRYDGSRAERDLGLQYRPVVETLRRTVEWLVETGVVPRSARG